MITSSDHRRIQQEQTRGTTTVIAFQTSCLLAAPFFVTIVVGLVVGTKIDSAALGAADAIC